MIDRNLKTVSKIYESFASYVEPSSVLMNFNDTNITAKNYIDSVELYCKHLVKLGIKCGSVIGYTMPNSPEAFYIFTAAARLGVCVIPLFHMIPDIGKANAYKNGRAQWIFTTSTQFAGLKEASDKINASYKIAVIDGDLNADYSFTSPVDDVHMDNAYAEISPDQPLLLATSSGTTGIPKAVAMTQSNIASEIYCSIDLVTPFGEDTIKGFKNTIAFPVSTQGIITVLGMILSNVTIIFSADISPVKFLQMISLSKSESMSAPPAFLEALISLPMIDTFDLTSVTMVQTGMDFLSPSLLKRIKEKFINLDSFANGYGLTETSNVFMIGKQKLNENSDNNTGYITLVEDIGNQIEVRDENGNCVEVGCEGELFVKGSNVIKGYLNNDEENQKSFKDGWFKTGDIARNEGNGSITLLGRRKYLIKRGGKSVSPIVVQNHINKLQGVKNSAVVGVPHQLYGEMIWAFIVKNPGSLVELKDVMKHCRSELANYMTPDQVVFIDEIPKNPGVGKVNFEMLKQLANDELKKINI